MKAEILRSPSEWSAPSVERAWSSLCRRHGRLEVLFQSPEWFGHLGQQHPDARRLVIIVQGVDEEIVALGALSAQSVDLDFVVGAREFGRIRLPSLVLLGGEPLAPASREAHDAFFAALADELGDRCLMMPMAVRDGLFRRFVENRVRRDRRFFLYAPPIPGHGRTHSLSMTSGFADYAQTHFNSKQRSNMKRRLKLLGQELGPVRLQRYRTLDEVCMFLDSARRVSALSWQYSTVGEHFEPSENWDNKLADLARRGVFRSYVLFTGDRPVAFVLGYQYADVFYHVKTGYDRSLSRLAPGIGLLYRMLEDLGTGHSRARVNFMFGDAEYKEEFGNAHVHSDELIMLQRTARNRVACSAHSAFRSGVTLARKHIRKIAPLRRVTAATRRAEE